MGSSTMAAKDKDHSDESGQSLIEFLIVLPLLVGVVFLLLRVNMAIQVSIVNQQYARAQALWLAFNSPVYPELDKRVDPQSGEALQTNQMIIGVSANTAPADETQRYVPEAPQQVITSDEQKAARAPASAAGGGPTGLVRIRSTVTLCSQSNVVNVGGQLKTISPATLVEGIIPANFEYCGGNL